MLIPFYLKTGLGSGHNADQVINEHKPPLHYSYGLHRRCSSLTDVCEPFPQYEDCHGEDRYFCSMWRSVGFLMTFAVVLMSLAIVAYIIILSGGKKLRETGWGVLSSIIILSVAVQVASMALIVSLFRLCFATRFSLVPLASFYLLFSIRRISSTTTIASLSDGSSTSPLFSALSAGAFHFSVHLLSSWRHGFCLPRGATNSFQLSIMYSRGTIGL